MFETLRDRRPRLWPAQAPRLGALAVTAALLGAGCTPHTLTDVKKASPVAAPEAFTAQAGEAAPPTEWFTAFGDPNLNALERKLLDRNLDLAAAAARFEQARFAVEGAEASWWPQVSASAGVRRSKSVFNFGGGGPIDVTNDSFAGSLAASYEIDVWGKVSSGVAAAKADTLAAAMEIQSLAMSLSATLADAWFNLVEQRALLALIEAQVATNTEQLDLLEARFLQGLASGVDVLQQKDVLLRAQSLLPMVHQRVALLEHQIAVLVREVPGPELKSAAELPEMPALPAVPVPAKLLSQRPDVRAAQARLSAADNRIAVAIANRLPGLKLSGNVGFQSFDLASFFESNVWSLAADIAGVVFDGGRLAADVDRSRAVLKERIASLGQVTLVALREVEDALVREARQREYLLGLDAQLAVATQLVDDTRARYVEGVGDYLPVLTSLRQLQTLEQQILSGRRQILSDRIQLYRALGGDWSKVVGEAGTQGLAGAKSPDVQAASGGEEAATGGDAAASP
jgi:NodT family efflux transporter outer membrane factor (OMF) lipoprotein